MLQLCSRPAEAATAPFANTYVCIIMRLLHSQPRDSTNTTMGGNCPARHAGSRIFIVLRGNKRT